MPVEPLADGDKLRIVLVSQFALPKICGIATIVDKVLRGTNPGDYPFELPTNSHFALNMRTATALKLAVPSTFLARVDEVIE